MGFASERRGRARLLGGLYVFLGDSRRHVGTLASFAAPWWCSLSPERAPAQSLRHVPVRRGTWAALLLTLVFRPLLLYGTPAHVVRPLLRPRWVMAVARVVTRRWRQALLFTGPIVIWHMPASTSALAPSQPAHPATPGFSHTAVLMWWPVLSPVYPSCTDPAPAPDAVPVSAGNSNAVTGALITLSDSVLYPSTRRHRGWAGYRRSTNNRSVA